MNESIFNLPPNDESKNNPEKTELNSSADLKVEKPWENPWDKVVREEKIRKEKLALDKVRQELNINKPQEPESHDKNISERVSMEHNKELAKSLVRLSNEVQEFEDILKQNKFSRVPLNANDFKKIIKDEQVDFSKALQVFDALQKDLSRDFMPKDNEDKLSIESHNFNRVIDSLNRLRVIFSGTKK